MIDVGRWQHTEFIQEMNVASIRTNLSATILSWFSDTALKEISKLINNGVYNIALQRLYKEVHIWVM